MTGTRGAAASPRPPAAPRHAPRVPFALLVVGLLVGGMCLLLALNTASAANELRRHDLASKDTSIGAQVEQLRNEVAASAAPGNLARVAAQLGMIPAGHPAFLEIGTDGSLSVLGSAAPATGAPLMGAAGAPSPTSSPAPSAPGSTPSPPGSTPTPSQPGPTPVPITALPGGTR